MMKATCQTLSIVLLMPLSCFAAQWRAHTKPVTTSMPSITMPSFDPAEELPQINRTNPATRKDIQQTSGATQAAAQAENLPQSNSGLPLLSCIGAGMALGGLVSARWWENRDK